MTKIPMQMRARTCLRSCVPALLVCLLLADAAHAQIRDTSKVRQTPAGWVLDFQQQPLRVVINALAEAGGLNVTTSNIPNRNVDLRMGQGLDKEGILDVLRGVVQANGLQIIESSSLIRIEGTPTTPPLTAAQMIAQQQAQNAPQLHTYRLKHASAVQLAPVLTSLFLGIRAGVTSTTFTLPNFQVTPQGLQISQPGRPPEIEAAMSQALQRERVAQALTERGAVGNRQGNAGNAGNAAVPPGRGGGGGGGVGGGGQALTPQQQRQQQQQQRQQQRQGVQNASLSSTAGDVRIVAEESSNSLLIRASAQDFALIQQIIGTVDLRPLQVLIEVTIAEVTRTDDLNVGLSGGATRAPAGKNLSKAEASLPGNVGARDFVLELTGGKGTIDFNVALNALATRGDLKVLSMPVIIAQNNREAVLNVGSRRPFVQVTQAGGIDPNSRVQTVQYIDVGTVLTITPTINPDGYVNLQVAQSANSASEEIQFDAPVINTREATTQVFVRDGQTTVIGGLADNSSSLTRSGIPILRDIPVLGWLFRGTQKNKSTSELFLFLTPHIVANDEDIDRLKDAIRNGSDLLKDVPVGGRIPPAGADTLAVPPIVRPPVTRPPVPPDTIPPQFAFRPSAFIR